MEYHGKLYGKMGEKYFDTGKTTEDWDSLLEALKDLVFTASKLWDDSKPIKDSDVITVTHPIIEAAKEAIKKATL